MFAVAAISMGVVPIIEYFVTSGINSNLKQRWLTVNIFIYPVIGYVIDNKVNVYKIKKSSFLLLWMVNLISFL